MSLSCSLLAAAHPPRLHLRNGQRRPALQERTVLLSRLVSSHALILCADRNATRLAPAPVLLADAGSLATSCLCITLKCVCVTQCVFVCVFVYHTECVCVTRCVCTLTKAPPLPPCPVASLARGIVIQVPSKSFSAARKNSRIQNLSHLSCAPRPPSCAPAHAPPSRPGGYGVRSPSSSHPLVAALPYSCSFEEAFVVVQHSPRHKISGP